MSKKFSPAELPVRDRMYRISLLNIQSLPISSVTGSLYVDDDFVLGGDGLRQIILQARTKLAEGRKVSFNLVALHL